MMENVIFLLHVGTFTCCVVNSRAILLVLILAHCFCEDLILYAPRRELI